MIHWSMEKIAATVRGIGIFLAGVFLTFGYYFLQANGGETCKNDFPLTNQSLDCGEYAESRDLMNELTKKLEQKVAAYTEAGKADRISVWVRNLETRQWAAVNQFETFVPASLLKVPLMVAFYKLAELQPNVLDTMLTYTPTENTLRLDEEFAPDHTLVPGNLYSVNTLIEHMILESDNDAALFLLSYIDGDLVTNVLIELGLKLPSAVSANNDFVTTKNYANVFRILYNASYLDRKYSQKALALLTQVKFEGMKKKLPASITLAHKYGERIAFDSNGVIEKRELHDCGIIYKTENRSFSLCIMTEGKNFDDLLLIIQDTALLVYEEI